MQKHASSLAVLARIPDLNVTKEEVRGEQPVESGLSSFGGRLLNQSLSVKLLSGLALLLIAASVLPYFFNRKEAAENLAPGYESGMQLQADSGENREEYRVAQNPAGRPATLVPASSEQVPAPEILSLQDEAKQESEAPTSSTWPKSAESDVPSTEAASRPMAVPATEYQADARSGNAPGNASRWPKENTNDQPANGNRYDDTRSSVY